MAYNNLTGRIGEDIAVDYLSQRGYRILHRNWRSGRYEIDIVAEKDDVIHIVEVKSSRYIPRFGHTSVEDFMAKADFDSAKIRKIKTAIAIFVYEQEIDNELSLDLLTVDSTQDNQYKVEFFESIGY